MKLKYFIPFLLLSSFVMVMLYVAWLGLVTSWTSHFMRADLGKTNLIILQASGLVASAVIGLLALPLGYVTRKRNVHYGFLLALLGLAQIFNPWNPDAMALFKQGLPEYLFYLISCWLFWSLGVRLGNRKPISNQSACTTV